MDTYKKKYEEANDKVAARFGTNVAKEIFTDLYENEDEKIRKQTLKVLNYYKDEEKADGGMPIEIDECITWLEKQEGCEYIKKDWLEHIKQSWYKEGFIDGKYTPKELTINDVTTLNELIDFLENGTAKLQHDLTLYANWLKTQFPTNEKQGEQKPADKVEPKFNVREWIVNNRNKDVFFINNINSRYYTLEDAKGIIYQPRLPLVENDFHLWTIQDAKDGDVLEFVDHERVVVGIVSFVCKRTGKVDVSCLLEDNKFKIGNFYALDTINPHPATKEQRDLLFEKMKEAGYEWNIEKKKLEIVDWSKHIKYEPNAPSIIEENPVWSEEDETYLDYIITAVKLCYPDDKSKENHWRNELLNWLKSLKDRVQPKQEWSEADEAVLDALIRRLEGEDIYVSPHLAAGCLKSLRPQNRWKPSEEQLEALSAMTEYCDLATSFDVYMQEVVESLYQDLKKLKEE